MTAHRPPPLRQPPATIRELPLLPWSSELWRIQDGPRLVPRLFSTPRLRFDAPTGEYPAIYASSSPVDAFAEVYRERASRLGKPEGRRYLCRLVPRAPLVLVDLRDLRVLVELGLDERICVGDDYATCQAWALAIYRRAPEVAGICYRSRLAGVLASNVLLFANRAGPTLDVQPEGQLRDLEVMVLTAAERFGLTVLFQFA